MCDMGKGGVSKSLVSLLHAVDYEKYNIDLFLFQKKGMFFGQIPDEVHILPENESAKQLLKRGLRMEAFLAVGAIKLTRNMKNLDKKWEIYWKYNKRIFRKNPKEYDIALAYNDGLELYYMADCIRAEKKIAYNHTDYLGGLTYKPNLDRRYYQKVNHIVTVSRQCAKSLCKVFPEQKHKISVIENIVDKEVLNELAGLHDPFQKTSKIKIVTVAGLTYRKGYDMALHALERLKKKGYRFKWIIIGDGEDRKDIEKRVRKSVISKDTVFLYEQPNPYPYVKFADIFLLASRLEGKSIAVEEAKLLEKPILITNFSTAGNQIISGKSGIIAQMNEKDIAGKLAQLMDDEALRQSLSDYLRKNAVSNRQEMYEKTEAMWEG